MTFIPEPVGTVRSARRTPVDGTPVIDIKPVMEEFLPRGPVREPDWARERMKDSW